MPKKMMFIDDLAANVSGMHDFISSRGVECYSFFYSKRKSKELLSYFPVDIFERELRMLEEFVGRLLGKEKVQDYFLRSYNREFIKAGDSLECLEDEGFCVGRENRPGYL